MADDDPTATLAGLRVRNADAIVERLDDPKTVASLLDLLDNAPTLNGVLTILQSFFTHSESVLENVKASLDELAAMSAGTPIATALPKAGKLAGQSLPLLAATADSDILDRVGDPELLALMAGLLDGVKAARAGVAAEPRRLTALGLLGAIKDPDVNRGLDFALRVLGEIGKRVN